MSLSNYVTQSLSINFFSIMKKASKVISFNFNISLCIALTFWLLIANQGYSQTISPTNGLTSNCQDCAPPGWADNGGTPDVSDSSSAADAPPTAGGLATWKTAPLPVPLNSHQNWLSLRDLGSAGAEESIRTTVSGLVVGREYEIFTYSLTAETNNNGYTNTGLGNFPYAGTYNDQFSFQIGSSAITNVSPITQDVWGTSKLRFTAAATSETLVLRPGNNAAYDGSNSPVFLETVQISISTNAINAVPVADDNSDTTSINTSTTFNITSTDVDYDGAIDTSSVDLDPATPGIQSSLTNSDGTWTVDSSGNVTFDPASGFLGVATLDYTVQDNYILDGVNNPSTSNPATLSVSVLPEPQLTVTKTSNATGDVNIGDTVTYTVEVENTGTVDASNVTLSDILPSGVSYIASTAMKTYNTDGVPSAATQGFTFTSDTFNGSGLTQNVPLPSVSSLPADAIITSFNYDVTVATNDWFSEISLVMNYPGGSVTLPQGTFGGNNDTVTVNANQTGSGAVSGSPSAIGVYEFIWDDVNNFGTNTVNSASFTIGYTSVSRTATTNTANAPVNMVVSSDAVTLQPGEKLTVTFDVIVNVGATGTLINTANASADGVSTPVAPATTSIVVAIDPCSVASGNVDTDGDGITDICDLDDDNDGILDTDEYGSCGISNGVEQIKFNEDFGTGNRTSTPYTNYSYQDGTGVGTAAHILDGEYAIIQNVRPFDINTGASNEPAWIFSGDNTGDVNGRMMAINAAATSGEVYRRTIKVVPNVEVYVDFSILNFLASNFNLDNPNIKFTIETLSGVELGSISTGLVPNNEQWNEYSLNLSPGNNEDIQIVLSSTSISSPIGGNDFGIDDIKVAQYFCDTDADGIPDYLDTDSDNDGCPDAFEGADELAASNTLLNGSNGGSSNNITASNSEVDSNGVPNVANGGQSTTTGVAQAVQLRVAADPIDQNVVVGTNITLTAAGEADIAN